MPGSLKTELGRNGVPFLQGLRTKGFDSSMNATRGRSLRSNSAVFEINSI